MDLSTEITQIQGDVNSLRIRLDSFENRSKSTIAEDRTSMLSALQDSVNSVETTYPLVERQYRLSLEYDTTQQRSNVEVRKQHIEIRKNVKLMNERFQALQKSADDGLEHIQDIKKTCDDYDSDLDRIKIRLTSLLERSRTALQNAEKLLNDKSTAVQDSYKTLKAQEKELSELDEKAEKEKIERDGVGSLAAITAASALLFPPMIFVAGGMAGWALSAHTDRRKFQQELKELQTRHNSLQAEHQTLSKQKDALQSAKTSTAELLTRCTSLISGTNRLQPIIHDKLHFYQDLKVTTDDFVSWTSDLSNQAESLEILGRSSKSLQTGLQRVVDTLVAKGNADVRRICTPLTFYSTSYDSKANNPVEDRQSHTPAARRGPASDPLERQVGMIITAGLSNSENAGKSDSQSSISDLRISTPVSVEEFVKAAKSGDLVKIVESIQAGVNINGKHRGWTALGEAANHGKLQIVETLLKHNADLEIRMDVGYGFLPGDGTAMNWAASSGHLDIVKALLAKGARTDVDAKKPVVFGTGGTPLVMAAGKDKIEVVKFLIEQAGVEEIPSDGSPAGWNAFMCACSEGSVTVLQYLIDVRKIDVNRRFHASGLETTILHIAAEKDQLRSIKVLVNKLALINAKNSNGDTALHILAEKGYKGAAIWMRLHGADLRAKNNLSLTPLDLARRRHDATSDRGVDLVKCLDWDEAEPEPENACLMM